MIVYLYSKCSTCKIALHYLQKKRITATIKEITNEPPSLEELEKMLTFQNGNVKKLLNTSGLLYREMQLSKRLNDMSLPEILSLLSSHGMLVKRPFLLSDEFGFTGFNEVEWSNKFA